MRPRFPSAAPASTDAARTSSLALLVVFLAFCGCSDVEKTNADPEEKAAPPNSGGWQMIRQLDIPDVDLTQQADRRLSQLANFNPDLSEVAVAPRGGGVRIDDTRTGRTNLVIDLPGYISSLAFAPDGRTLAIGEGTNLVICSAKTGQVESRVSLMAAPREMAFSKDGTVLAFIARNGGLMFWDMQQQRSMNWSLATTGEAMRRLTNIVIPGVLVDGASGFPANTFALSPDGTEVATGHERSTVHLWKAADGRHVRKIPEFSSNSSSDWVSRLAFSPDQSLLGVVYFYRFFAVVDQSGNVKWLESMDSSRKQGSATTEFMTYALAFSPTGRYLAAGGLWIEREARNPAFVNLEPLHGGIRLWDLASGRQLPPLSLKPQEEVYSLVFDGRGTQLAAISGPFWRFQGDWKGSHRRVPPQMFPSVRLWFWGVPDPKQPHFRTSEE